MPQRGTTPQRQRFMHLAVTGGVENLQASRHVTHTFNGQMNIG
jgi:hypothetical protein